MRKVTYELMTFDTPNPIARYAHRTRLRRSVSYASSLLSQGGAVLDFGCGTGNFLNSLKASRPDVAITGYDPFLSGAVEHFRRVQDITALQDSSIDLLTCFEVLEHLSDENVSFFISQAARLLKPGGVALVSVPIIGGPTLLLKEANHVFLYRRWPEYRLGELLRCAFFGIPAERAARRGSSHKGFDFRALRRSVASSFYIARQMLCPFPYLPWWLNSQVFFVLHHHKIA